MVDLCPADVKAEVRNQPGSTKRELRGCGHLAMEVFQHSMKKLHLSLTNVVFVIVCIIRIQPAESVLFLPWIRFLREKTETKQQII